MYLLVCLFASNDRPSADSVHLDCASWTPLRLEYSTYITLNK